MRCLLTVLTLALAGVLAAANPASAATLDQKVALLSSFTQPTAASQAAWAAARRDPGAYADYHLDWSTDYCSDSPDQPLGFDFRMPCARHDFGYRNYTAVARFPGNKDRIDTSFYYDLKVRCARYNVVVRPACYSLAWTYYEAVHNFGSVVVSKADLDRAAAYKAALRRQAVASAQD